MTTGKYIHGEPWCSTKTDSSNNHTPSGSYYGDCPIPLDKNCPSADTVDGKYV